MHIYQIHATPLLSTSGHAAFPHLRQSHPRPRQLIPLPLPPRPPRLHLPRHLPHRPLLHVPLSLTPPPPPKRDLGPLLDQLAITIGGRAEVGDEHGQVPTGGGFRRRHFLPFGELHCSTPWVACDYKGAMSHVFVEYGNKEKNDNHESYANHVIFIFPLL